MRENNQPSWNRQLTAKEARLGILIIVWAVVSFGTMFFFPKVGVGLLILGVLIAQISALFWRRGMTPEQQTEIQESMREFEKKGVMRAFRYTGLAVLAYLIFKTAATQLP